MSNFQWIQPAYIWYLQYYKTGQTWNGQFFCQTVHHVGGQNASQLFFWHTLFIFQLKKIYVWSLNTGLTHSCLSYKENSRHQAYISCLLYTIRINSELPIYFPALMGFFLVFFMKTIYPYMNYCLPGRNLWIKGIKQSQVGFFPLLLAKWLFCNASDNMTSLKLIESSDHTSVLTKYIKLLHIFILDITCMKICTIPKQRKKDYFSELKIGRDS